MNELPESVRRNLIVQICKQFRDDFSFFRKMKENVVMPLHLLMRQFMVAKDELILREGDVAREVYFLILGEVSVYVNYSFDQRKRVSTLGSGAMFGEQELGAGPHNLDYSPKRKP